MDKVRLAFCGASGTGKSTLATAMAERLGYLICPVGSRSVSAAMGFENPYDVDAAGVRVDFQKRLLSDKRSWERTHDEFVTDRTHLDNFAYTMEHAPSLALDYDFRSQVDFATKRYTHIVFCPMSAVFRTDGDPHRIDERLYHERFEDRLRRGVSRFARWAPILWLTSADHDVRVNQVSRFVCV